MLSCPKCGAPNPERNDFCDDCATRLTESSPGIDRYTLEGVLGRGASSVVYRATDSRTGRAVAVKALNPELLARPGLRERLREEARALQQLSHENVVGVVDYVENDEGVWLVTEAVEGVSLRTVLIHAHQLEPEQALAIFGGMLAGIAHAHERGLVHGDLKPENVLVESSGTAKLVDFGQAVRAGQATTGGTAAYMSPEAVRGETVGPAADLYSVGAVLYEALAGRPPFIAASEQALLSLQLSEPSPPLVGVPPAIGSLVASLLEKDPAKRPPSAAAALGTFEAAVREGYGTEWRRRSGVASLIETSATRFPTMASGVRTGAQPGGVDASAPYAGVGATPADGGDDPQLRRAVAGGVSFLRWVLSIELLWLLTFAAGGALLIWRFYQHASSNLDCFSHTTLNLGTSTLPNLNCGPGLNLVLPIVLIAIGFVASIVTWIVASTLAVKRYGVSFATYVRRRRYRPAGVPFAGSTGATSWPGTPGSPTAPFGS